MTTIELIEYYVGLLILQYLGLPNAEGTIAAVVNPVLMPQVTTEEISFSAVAASGAFVLSYGGNPTASINWNDSVSTIQTKLQAVSGLGSVTVAGSIASKSLVVTFTGVTPVADLLVVGANTLQDGSSNPISIGVVETDLTLPLAVQNAFELGTAVGAQLDVIGKYAGVTRTGQGFTGSITLDDSDFTALIQVAIVRNQSGSSLSIIQALLHMYFAGELFVFDYANMHMSYLMSSAVGSQNLAELFVSEGLLPKPMGVQLAALIYAPVINMFFGMRTYELPAVNVTPLNDYASYQTDWPMVSYQDAIVI